MLLIPLYSFFFFNDTATTEIYTLSLHDALPIYTDSVVIEPEDITTDGSFEDAGTTLTLDEPSVRSEEHTSELQSQSNLVCRLLLEKKKIKPRPQAYDTTQPETSIRTLRTQYYVS